MNISIIFHSDEAQQKRQGLEKESRDEILVKIGELEAQKRVLVALQAGAPSQDLIDEFERLQTSLLQSDSELTRFADNTEQLRQRCLISRIRAKANTSYDDEACEKYAQSSSNASEHVNSNTELFACVQDLDFQINSFEQSREALNQTALQLEQRIEALRAQLASTDVKFSHLARDAQHAADSKDQLDSKWLQFSFDSKRYQSSSSSSYSRKTSQIATSVGGGGFFWSVGGSYSHSRSRSESRFRASMNRAQTVVSGELLRVTIQRPWFRPSIFKNPQLQIRVCDTYHSNASKKQP